MTLLDFTSALYLGFHHPSISLRPWTQLTSGRPAALGVSQHQNQAAQFLAKLTGCEAGVLGPSTLHLFLDLFGILARGRTAIYIDAGAYPIGTWGASRVAGRGAPIYTFRHHDAIALQQLLARDAANKLMPLVLTDGLCPGCGHIAPLVAYSKLINKHQGYLIIDDTQAMGVLGKEPNERALYGKGGGGSLCRTGVIGPRIVVVNSLAKGFGVPVALLAASNEMVAYFKAQSETRVHCSPPSMADVRAAEHAFILNKLHGDSLRSRLVQLVLGFRRRLMALGFHLTGGAFPIQTLRMPAGVETPLLHSHLLERGIRTVLHQPRCRSGAAISFLITQLHRFSDFDYVALAIQDIFRETGMAAIIERETHHEQLVLAYRYV